MKFRLVPAEATPEMREAAASFGGDGGYSAQRGDEACESYRAMLQATPELSEAEIDQLCRMMWGDRWQWKTPEAIAEEIAPDTPRLETGADRDDRERLRNEDRARMRRFIK